MRSGSSRTAGDARLSVALAAVARLTAAPREPAAVRLERELGPELAQRLVASLRA